MEFIDQASSGKNNFFSYLTGTLIILGLFLLGNSALFFYLNFQFPNEPIDSWTQSKITASLGKTELLFWLTFPFALVFFGLIFHINKVHGRTISSIFTGKEKYNWKRSFFSFGLVFGILALSLVVQSFFGLDLQFQFDIQKFLPLLLVSLIMLSIQTTCEEVIFRSYLLQGFKNRLRSNKAAVLISGIMFGAIHIGNPDYKNEKDGGYFAGAIVDWDFEPTEIYFREFDENVPTDNGGANQQFKFKFLDQYKPDIDKLLKIALDNSPIKKVCFLTDYQFGPEDGKTEIIFTISDFWAQHDSDGLNLNTIYEMYGL
ncbi:MAG: CPBP family intramembrane glutamic endopeptidase [Crocinitomicaceae bacterium]